MKIEKHKYIDLSNTVEKELGLILGRITHHIHPSIVDYITETNIEFERRFSDFAPTKLDSSCFFYEGSDSVFPGFRRPINKEKTGKWKNNVNEIDGTILNDNTFPRHIWAFLTNNTAYAGGMWGPSGLDRFELAHIFGHKKDERNLEKEAFGIFSSEVQPYGLFTSASNVVLIPKGLAKPTDHMRNIKLCFYRRHIELYGYNMVELDSFNDALLPEWYDDIQWLEPQLPNQWKEKIDNLLVYREKYLRRKYA